MLKQIFCTKIPAIISLLWLVFLFGGSELSAQEQEQPEPRLTFTRTQDIVSNDTDWTVYFLDVENKADYSAELFAAAPDLPPCGRNQNASRSWVNIYGQSGKRIYGFCALKSPLELGTLAFQLPKGIHIREIYIVIYDRKLNRQYKSQVIELPKP